MKTLNLTQHPASKEQVEAGVIDLLDKDEVSRLLTFDSIPDKKEIEKRVTELSTLIYEAVSGQKGVYEELTDDEMSELLKEKGIGQVMIGGALWLMKPLIEELTYYIKPVFAFSKRETIEKLGEDGEVVKTSVFKHIGFVEAI